MKQLTTRMRAHFVRRAEYEAKRRRRARTDPIRVAARVPLQQLTVRLAADLDLIDNAEETRRQLASLDRACRQAGPRVRLQVDMRELTHIDPCALLHLAAQLDALRQRGGRASGNYPSSENARSALRDAQFEQFMGSPERLGRVTGTSEIEIRCGDRDVGLRPRDWSPLHAFIKAHGHLADEEADGFYTAFGECVENVLQHAYRGRRGRWYALAIRPTDRPARAVVLDLGIGIPQSIRQNTVDTLRKNFGRALEMLRAALQLAGESVDDEDDGLLQDVMRRIEAFDWSCVHLATLGKRTETGEMKRGKGLSELRKVVLEQKSGALHVLSGRAAVTWSYGSEPRATNLTHLRGTVVCLELGSAQETGTHDAA